MGTPPSPILESWSLIYLLEAVKLAIHYIKKNSVINGASTPSKGTIICTASNAGLYPFPVAPIYAASKFGVNGLVRSMARPLAKEAIQINALAPAVLGEYFLPRPETGTATDRIPQRQTLLQAKTCLSQ